MGKEIKYNPDEIDEVGKDICPDIANFYDDITSKAANAGRSRDSAFGDHGLRGTWDDLYNLYYEIVFETGRNVRTMGKTLEQIAEEQVILEGDLASGFDDFQDEIDGGGYTPVESDSFDSAPDIAPDPDAKDDNPNGPPPSIDGPH